MNGVIDFLKALYYKNKSLFLVAVLVLVIFIAGCSSQGSAPSGPSGPIGGGC